MHIIFHVMSFTTLLLHPNAFCAHQQDSFLLFLQYWCLRPSSNIFSRAEDINFISASFINSKISFDVFWIIVLLEYPNLTIWPKLTTIFDKKLV